MKLGLWRQPRGAVGDFKRIYDEILEEAVLADEFGFSSFYVSEHHYQPDRISPVLSLLTAIAARTSQIGLGTSCCTLPLRHPMDVAEQVAMLDVVSNGPPRLLSLGYVPVDFAPFEVPFSERIDRSKEALEILRLAWKGEPFSYEGHFFHLSDVAAYPTPLQRGGPAIMLGAWARGGARYASEWADGWLADNTPSMSEIAVLLSEFRRDRRPGRVVLMRDGWVARDRAQAESQFGPLMTQAHWFYFPKGLYRREFNPWIDEVKSETDFTFERLARDSRFVYGSPEDCIETLRVWESDYGIDEIVVGCRYGDRPSHETVMEQISLWGERDSHTSPWNRASA